jgi:hypothetical protein
MITGALIGSAITSPVVALPIAFISHFVLDVLPHYGDDSVSLASKQQKMIIGIDTAVAVSFFLLIILSHPAHWPVMVFAGILAMSPDLMWLPNYIRTLRGLEEKSLNIIMKIHKNIQWGERPWGLAVEAVWFAVFVPMFILILWK